MQRTDLTDDRMCFACGKDNNDGLHLEFTYEDGEVSTSVAFPRRFQGYRDVVHGGLLGTVLDEVMVTLVNKMGYLAVTAELSVRFLAPLAVDERVDVRASLVERRGNTFELSAVATKLDGTEVAKAKSRCVSVGRLEDSPE